MENTKNKLTKILTLLLIFGVLSPLAMAADNAATTVNNPVIYPISGFGLDVGNKYTIPNSGMIIQLMSIDYLYPIDGPVDVGSQKVVSLNICSPSGEVGTCAVYSQVSFGNTIKYVAMNGDILKITPSYVNDKTVYFNYELNKKSIVIAPPVITGVGGPQKLSVNEQGTWKISAYDKNGRPLYYSVDWGEYPVMQTANANVNSAASTAQQSTFTHTYSESGIYTVTFTVTNSDGKTAQSTMSVVVESSTSHPDIAVTDVYAEKDVYAGQKAIFHITVQNVGNADAKGYSLGYDYGEGVGQAFATIGTLSPGQKKEYITTHLYSYSGTYGFKATARTTDDINQDNDYQAIKITVLPVNTPGHPVIDSVNGPAYLDTNTQGTWTINAHDSDNNYLTYSVDWGDNRYMASANTDSALSVAQTSTLSHTYTESGVYTITFAVTDNNGETAKYDMTVNIGDKIVIPEPVISTTPTIQVDPAQSDVAVKKAKLNELYAQLQNIIQQIIALSQ